MRKRMYVLAVITLLAVGVAWAHGEKAQAGKMDPAAHAAKLKAELGLSDAQTEQVKAALEDIHQRMAEVKAKAGEPGTMEAKKKLKAERDARLKAILTPEQFARYQEMMAQHAREGRKHQK